MIGLPFLEIDYVSPHESSHSIFSKMSAMKILKPKYLYQTRVLYAKLAGRFCTFAKYSRNATIEEVIHRPKPLLVAQAMHVMMQTYVLVARDPTPSLRTVHHRFSMAIPGFKTIPCNWVEA